MNPADLSASLLDVVSGIIARRGSTEQVTIEDVPLERPRSREHGDWASNIAMKLAKPIGVAPRELADEIAIDLARVDGVARVDVAGPGFINITLDAAAAGALARVIVEQDADYGRGDLYEGVTMNLEFVSANPTGPLHIGGVRWAAVGDSLARIFSFEGGIVTSPVSPCLLAPFSVLLSTAQQVVSQRIAARRTPTVVAAAQTTHISGPSSLNRR